jgi:hypothetical protein
MVKLPWYGNLPNAFIQETVFAILKCSNPEKPWIKLTSSTEKIIDTVNKCPSGALTYYKINKKREKNYRFWLHQ